MKPIAHRDISLCYRDEARQPRFGGKQIVTSGIESAVRDPVSDREKLACRVEEKAEIDRCKHLHRDFLQRQETTTQGLGSEA